MVTDELAAFLVERGLATGVNVDVFGGDAPDRPDRCLIIQPFSGPKPEETTTDAYHIEHPGVNILVRDTKGNRGSAYVRAETILRTVGSVSNRMISGVWYLSVRPATSSPISMPDDERGRPSYSLNFEVTKYPSPVS
jgi:hypothetical protein